MSFDKTTSVSLEALLSVRETCRFFGCSRPTLYRTHIEELGLPFVKIKGRTMFEPEALREFIARHRVGRNNDDDSPGSESYVRTSGVEAAGRDPD